MQGRVLLNDKLNWSYKIYGPAGFKNCICEPLIFDAAERESCTAEWSRGGRGRRRRKREVEAEETC